LPTGSTIASVSGVALNGGITNPAINLFPIRGSLQAGSTYWLVMASGSDDAVGGWQWNSIGQTGMAFSGGGGAWDTGDIPTSTLRVNSVVAAPEPCTLALLTLGGMSFLAKKRHVIK
jgi:hypothetical protein